MKATKSDKKPHLKRHLVMLDSYTRHYAMKIGGGNLSRGLREAVKDSVAKRALQYMDASSRPWEE